MPRLTSRSSIKHCREPPRQAQWLVPVPLCGHANRYRVEELGFAKGRGLSSPALFCEKNFYGQPQVDAACDPAIVVRKGIPSPTLSNQGSRRSKGESRLAPGEQCGQRKYPDQSQLLHILQSSASHRRLEALPQRLLEWTPESRASIYFTLCVGQGSSRDSLDLPATFSAS